MNEEKFKQLLTTDTTMMEILTILHTLQLKDSWICAGTLRNFVWNHLSGHPGVDLTTDVDLVYFDPESGREEALALEKNLLQVYPAFRWEVKNQVYMHTHNPNTAPYLNTKDAIRKFPETCTSIGARLLDDGRIDLFAPYGLDDLLAFIVRPTPYFLSDPERRAVYARRLHAKKWEQKWPQLIFYPTPSF